MDRRASTGGARGGGSGSNAGTYNSNSGNLAALDWVVGIRFALIHTASAINLSL
jgi:hypothetical protein